MPIELLTRFLSEYPSQREAAQALAISEAYVSRLKNGTRKVNPRIAQKIEQVSDGRYRKDELLWGVARNGKHGH